VTSGDRITQGEAKHDRIFPHVGVVYVTRLFIRSDRSTSRVEILSLSSTTSSTTQKRFDPYAVLRLIIMMRITNSSIIYPWTRRRLLATHIATAPPTAPPTRHDWTKEEVQRIYDIPLLDLVFRSASVHRQYHDPTKIQLCTLMNIKSKQYR
jgi:hypothetical protein